MLPVVLGQLSAKSLKGLPIDTLKYFCRLQYLQYVFEIYGVSTVSCASKERELLHEEFAEIETHKNTKTLITFKCSLFL